MPKITSTRALGNRWRGINFHLIRVPQLHKARGASGLTCLLPSIKAIRKDLKQERASTGLSPGVAVSEFDSEWDGL